MAMHVKEVARPREWRLFLKFPLSHYAGDPYYVPHLMLERKEFFSRRNPLFEFTEVAYFLARGDGGKVLGRISAHINQRHNEYAGEKTGFFGFFESVRDLQVAQALFASAEEWLERRGMSLVRGPFNFSTNEECGLLVRGFDSPPVFMMPYTKQYYLRLVSDSGYRKAKDLLAYSLESPSETPRGLERLAARVQRRTNLRVRSMRRENFEEDVKKAFDIYNQAWKDNWGFVPMSETQFAHMARTLKPVIDPALALIAEKDGRAVGFCLGLPDYNILFRKMGGRLLPYGWVYLLFGRSLVDRARIITLGVVEEYRQGGVDVLLLYHMFRNGIVRGYQGGELSWILEDNASMNRIMQRFGAVPYKTYRIYEKRL